MTPAITLEPDELDIAIDRKKKADNERIQFHAVMTLAGFEYKNVFELENQYWPKYPRYYHLATPWYLFMTQYGPIKLGWRKKVISIEWTWTPFRGEVTKDEVTMSKEMVHAWTNQKALEYATLLKLQLEKVKVEA